ncbi:hypothetical protein COU75_02010 [Candidatus Peregrinibacteria bacterium CG10_big_fil_rev_8_21_14_0_10_42_8]|nr:MAG: hypothetical protein COU75_02010 [Candidatus Peregrinibacteria bacterium CG10_big_fil_rev_8_21_14_0_10_42_8]
MSGPSQTPSEFKSHLLNKINKKEDITITDPDRAEAMEEVGRLEKAKRDKLRQSIEEYRTTPPDTIEEQEEEILSSLEKEIDNVNALEEAKGNQVIQTPKQVEKQLSPFEKFTDSFTAPLKGIMKSLIAVLPLSLVQKLREANPGGFFGRYANEILQEKGVYAKMEEVFGSDKMKRTTDDEAHIKTLQQQYNRLPALDSGSKISFEEFYSAKMKAALKTGSAEYTLLDVVNAKADVEKEQKKVENESKKQNEKERKRLTMQERMKIPKVKHATRLFAMANAIQSINGRDFGMNKDEITKDLYDRENGKFHYESVSEQLINYLKSNEAIAELGLSIDGGDLESDNGTEWFYDPDIISNFESNLRNSPTIAFDQLVDLVVDPSWNPDTQRNIPKIQNAMRLELVQMDAASFDAPEETSEEV